MEITLTTLDMQKLTEGFTPQMLPTQDAWIRICGLEPKESIMEIGRYLGIHTLTIEDILNREHQPKYEAHKTFRLFILKTFITEKQSHIAIILKDRLLVTFEEDKHSFITHYAREKLPNDLKRVVYELLDCTVDHYLQNVHSYRERVDAIEDRIFDNDEDFDLSGLFDLRREIRTFRRLVRPVQDMAERLQSENLFDENMSPYLKDLWDHASKVNQSNDVLCEALDRYQNETFTRFQYRLSSNMNVMTALSVIVMPTLIITGLYGMNFDNMPGTNRPYGYFVVLGITVFVVLATLILFKRRKIF